MANRKSNTFRYINSREIKKKMQTFCGLALKRIELPYQIIFFFFIHKTDSQVFLHTFFTPKKHFSYCCWNSFIHIRIIHRYRKEIRFKRTKTFLYPKRNPITIRANSHLNIITVSTSFFYVLLSIPNKPIDKIYDKNILVSL